LCFEMIPGVSHIVAQFDQNRMRMGTAEFQSALLAPGAFRLLHAFGTCSYSISPLGARALKDFCLPFRNLTVFFPGLNRSIANVGLDVMMNALYPEINAFVSFPPLVITKNGRAISTVQGRRRPLRQQPDPPMAGGEGVLRSGGSAPPAQRQAADPSRLLDQAFALHQSGSLVEAAHLYSKILQ